MVRQHGYNYNTTISAVEFPGTAAPPFVLAMQEVTALLTAAVWLFTASQDCGWLSGRVL